jgi:hypothetical protein
MTEAEVRHSFLRQAQACETLGSPFTAKLCRLAAERMTSSTAVEAAVLEWTGDPTATGDAVALRLAGALHALALLRADDDLVAVYPPNHPDDDRLWGAIIAAFRTHETFILERLASAPQTNEVRRSAALLPGFLTISALTAKPLRLMEIGASAGLNLHWDRYRYHLGESEWGDPSSAVRLAPDWEGPPPPETPIEVTARSGCDLNPLDPNSDEDRLRLLSYLWADQSDRVSRTRAALDIARAHPAAIDKADARAWLDMQLAQPFPGVATVVYHSIAWQYLPSDARRQGEAIIAAAGGRATDDAPLCRLQMEADGGTDGAALTLQIWPTGEMREIGRADFHGRWVKWRGW